MLSPEQIVGKGSKEGDLLSLIDQLRHVSGVHEVHSLLDGSAEPRGFPRP